MWPMMWSNWSRLVGDVFAQSRLVRLTEDQVCGRAWSNPPFQRLCPAHGRLGDEALCQHLRDGGGLEVAMAVVSAFCADHLGRIVVVRRITASRVRSVTNPVMPPPACPQHVPNHAPSAPVGRRCKPLNWRYFLRGKMTSMCQAYIKHVPSMYLAYFGSEA